jgi:CRP/FNR family transcriptional regulator, cyclic AMP receptor protein
MRGNGETVSADMSVVVARRQPHGARCGETAHTCDVRRALIASGIFRKTAPEVASAYAKQLTPVRFPPGRVFDDDSDSGGRLYVIVSGKIKVSYRNVDGREVLVTTLGSPDIYGIIKLFDSEWQRARAATLTATWVVPIRRDQLLTWMAERPEICDQVLRLFARRVRATTKILIAFSGTEVQARIASRLLCLKKRFGCREGEGVRVAHDLTLQEFSLLVGVAPVTVAAALREFEDRGWIRMEGNEILIEDAQALHQLQMAPMSEVCGV